MLYVECQVKKVFANHTMDNLPSGSVHFSVTLSSLDRPTFEFLLSRPPGYKGTPTATEIITLLMEDLRVFNESINKTVEEFLEELGYGEEDLDEAIKDLRVWREIMTRSYMFLGEETAVAMLDAPDTEAMVSLVQELCQRELPDLAPEFLLFHLQGEE